MKNKTIFIAIITLSIVLFISFTAYSFFREIKSERLPVLGQVRDFSLMTHNMEEFALKDLNNKVWVADFIFTTCAGICPIMSKNMAALNRTFEQVNNVRLVSISVNPEYDSPQILAEYARKLNANKNWIFLTGSRQQITDLAVKSFKLGAIDEPVFHSGYFSLVDKSGLIRGYYDGTQQEQLNQLFKDAAQLVKERH